MSRNGRLRKILPWQLVALAVAVVGWISTALLWQSSVGWNIQIVGNVGQWVGSIATAIVLAFTIWEVFSERRFRFQREEGEKEEAQIKEASRFTVWPTRQTNNVGNPIGWAIGVQNNSGVPIFNWKITASAYDATRNESAELEASSAEHGAIPPSQGSATLYPFTSASNKAGLTFYVSVTWVDVRGDTWISENGYISRRR